jgi:hypothetical protein
MQFFNNHRACIPTVQAQTMMFVKKVVCELHDSSRGNFLPGIFIPANCFLPCIHIEDPDMTSFSVTEWSTEQAGQKVKCHKHNGAATN